MGPQESTASEIRLERGQLDKLPWPIVRVNQAGEITYGNRKICELTGRSRLEGVSIDVLFDDANLKIVREHLQSRFVGEVADEYQVELIRQDGSRLPILCSAMPEFGPDGHVVGAFAIVRDLLTHEVSQAIHGHIEELRSAEEILKAVARETQRIASFDLFSVTIYSKDRRHFRSPLMWSPERGEWPSTVRWREMTPFIQRLLEQKRTLRIDNLEDWLKQPGCESLRDDPDVQGLLAERFLSWLSYHAVRGDRIVATVSFGRRPEKGPFSASEEEDLGALPLQAALRMALHYQETENLQFILELVRKLSGTPCGTDRIAEILVEEIAGHYGWPNVSIFEPDEQHGQIRLLQEKALQERFIWDRDLVLRLDEGVLGHVFRTAKLVNIGDVSRDEDFKNIFVAAYPDSKSELCVPIMAGGRVHWLLNTEDSRTNAYSTEEITALEEVAHEVGVLLEKATQHQLLSEIMDSAKDAILVTDLQGSIQRANPWTGDLLGYTEAEMKGNLLASYFEDERRGQRIVEAAQMPNDEVSLLHKNGSTVDVLLSANSLPKEGLKVYFARDLSVRKRIETMEVLRHMYNEIAAQTKTPLSMACTWLSRMARSETRPETVDRLVRVLKQLHRVDISFDRLLFYQRDKSLLPHHETLFDVPLILDGIMAGMPAADKQLIETHIPPDLPPLRGDLYQISFCIESILSYFLRFASDEAKIEVDALARDSGVVISLRGHVPEVTGGKVTDYTETRWAIQTITEMALGEETIRVFVEDHNHGRFHSPDSKAGPVEYKLELPAA